MVHYFSRGFYESIDAMIFCTIDASLRSCYFGYSVDGGNYEREKTDPKSGK